ncbi:hypothetical protein A9G29_02425 [Gilliamella sp. Fer2-1]|jgi:antitoxin YobK|uniref:SMI1/KNR4 family protein n=1 Tax=Gilliamella sp. Nev6-6 TaxID=3120252 RepID=UPI00080F3F5C|nr:SMI1/KNR4 family protein [Gilliamella apicola]OCG35163.1 hypothetical protein A9G29_02425 [Gilliamella apicola]OCG78429.1 hypothetical protein A9G42_03175 [Gilliamella apicola]
MSVQDVIDTINVIERNSENADFLGHKDPNLVIAAEKSLNITFPNSYRYFLTELGAGGIYGQEFYGVINNDFINSGIPDAIWLTLKERKESNLPEYLVLIYFGGDGDYYAIDCRDPNNAPIVYWEPGASQENDKLHKIADDFGAFFKETILNAKENW